MPQKTTSPYITVKESAIHNKGVYAKIFIPAGAQVIEYVGEKITKAEAERRALVPLTRHKNDQERHGAVYIFELNKRYDIDGDVPYNTARYLNHSCEPNCETENDGGHIWITALRDIMPGEELTYNYGYGFEDYQDHQCRCGSERCIGFILDEKFWPEFMALKKDSLDPVPA
jgi:uncharacterized protein